MSTVWVCKNCGNRVTGFLDPVYCNNCQSRYKFEKSSSGGGIGNFFAEKILGTILGLFLGLIIIVVHVLWRKFGPILWQSLKKLGNYLLKALRGFGNKDENK